MLSEAYPDAKSSLNKLIEFYESWGKPDKVDAWRVKPAVISSRRESSQQNPSTGRAVSLSTANYELSTQDSGLRTLD